MLSSALILITFEVLCHAALALLHLWHLPSLSHEARETLVGRLYAGLAGGLLVGAIAYAQLAERRLEPGGTLSSLEHGSGLGDLTLVLATWPYADHELGRYAAVAGYVTQPTGSYDAMRTLSLNTNPGENRWQAAVQAGYSHRLGSRGNVMTAFDAQWFGDNDAYRRGSSRIGTLEQRLLYNWQIAFSYTPAAPLTLGLSYFYSQGGASRIDGAPWHNALRVHRYTLSALSNCRSDAWSCSTAGTSIPTTACLKTSASPCACSPSSDLKLARDQHRD